MSRLLSVLVAAAMLSPSQAGSPTASRVAPLFDLASPDRSPFPSDRFTVPDGRQITGRRVNLPMPDCTARASDCEDVAVLNQLDGFNLEARISVPFSGAIDPSSVNSRSVFLVRVGDGKSSAPHIGINYIVWDPATRELSFRPDQLLDEHTTYALLVTTGVRAADGRAIGVAS